MLEPLDGGVAWCVGALIRPLRTIVSDTTYSVMGREDYAFETQGSSSFNK